MTNGTPQKSGKGIMIVGGLVIVGFIIALALTMSKLSQTKAELNQTKTNLDQTKTELNQTKSHLGKDKSLLSAELNQTKTELDQTKTELNQTKARLGKDASLLSVQLDQTKAELDQTKADLDLTKAELDQTKADLDLTEAELKETEGKLAQAQTELDKIKEEAKWGRYKVTLNKRNLADLDWKKSTFGGTLDINMTVYKDGKEVYSVTLNAERGEHEPKGRIGVPPKQVDSVSFEIDYAPSSKYVIKWKELATVAKTSEYTHTWEAGTKPGDWLFNKRISIATDSWFQFSAQKVK